MNPASALAAMRAYLVLLRRAPPLMLAVLAVTILLASLTDGIGILLLVPLLGVLGGGAAQGAVPQWLNGFASAGSLPLLLGIFVALIALRSLIVFVRDYLNIRLQHQIIDDLRQRCFAALLGAEWRWLATVRQSDQVNLLTTEVARVGMGLYTGMQLVVGLITAAVYALAALLLSPMLAGIAFAGGAVIALLVGGRRGKSVALGLKQSEANRNLHAGAAESLGAIKLAKVLGNEKRHLARFTDTVRALRAEKLAFAVSTGAAQALFQTAAAVMLVGYVYLGTAVWSASLAELVTLVLIFGRLAPMLMGIQQNLHLWLHALPALQATDRLLADTAAAAEPQPAAPTPRPLTDVLVLQDIRFTYPDREASALDGVTVRLAARSTTALIGASGSGKSTLADIVMGLLVPDAGIMRVDGEAITGDARIGWRRGIAYVPQETILFHDSIRANLAWADAEADEAAMWTALDRAAADFVRELPAGLDTVVGDGGLRLSGGERQRLALARALLGRPTLLILDEATSALDTANEAKVRRAIEQIHGDLTVLIIGHRLATLEHADQVVMLDRGRVVAQGSWAEVRAVRDADVLPG